MLSRYMPIIDLEDRVKEIEEEIKEQEEIKIKTEREIKRQKEDFPESSIAGTHLRALLNEND